MSGAELAQKLADAREAGARLRADRDDAVRECLAAVRAVEAAIVEALDGEVLRGLPDLGGGLRAASVRGKKVDRPLPVREGPAGRGVLVLNMDGRLRMAWRAVVGADLLPTGEVAVLRDAEDEDLLAEDVEDLSRAAEEVLDAHVARVEKTACRFAELRELARRLRAALEA